MNLSIILPISKYLNGDREDHLFFIKNWYNECFPDAEIIISIDNSNRTLFCKSKAINDGVKLTTKDNLLIADIDMYISKFQILENLKKIDKYGWIIPYDKLIKLDKKQTFELMHGNIFPEENKYYNLHVRAGGLQLVTKEVFNLVKGYDERFIGWGGEDTSFCASIECLYKQGYKSSGESYHLYHARQENIALYKKNNNNRKLRNMYWEFADIKNIEGMKRLIEMRDDCENN